MTTTTQPGTEPRNAPARPIRRSKNHSDLVGVVAVGGARDALTTDDVLELLPSLPNWVPREDHRRRNISWVGAHTILRWLESHPGDGWQARWLSSGADADYDWIDSLRDPDDRRVLTSQRGELSRGMTCVLLCRIVSYKLPETGEIVPMLQIVPSKSNEERLLMVSPELASVLATIITRLRAQNGGSIPLTTRYDQYERVMGPPLLPHLFQHRHGWQWQVPNSNTVQKWLTSTLARTGLTDAAGQPLRYTPHDFRRMFATESVNGKLPVHIVAKLLGHKNLNTTQAYLAVFDEELVRSYRAFLDSRRALRPETEYREPTEQEWQEFQQHLERRTLELGTCGRPYGTPCKHEHACIRCPSLRVDPHAHDRLVQIIANLRDRIAEARINGWTGEVEGLKVSLNAAAAKLVSLERMRDRTDNEPGRITALGIPTIK